MSNPPRDDPIRWATCTPGIRRSVEFARSVTSDACIARCVWRLVARAFAMRDTFQPLCCASSCYAIEIYDAVGGRLVLKSYRYLSNVGGQCSHSRSAAARQLVPCVAKFLAESRDSKGLFLRDFARRFNRVLEIRAFSAF